jgi:DNA (cytosine-5)-methyltransferase 1
MTAFYNDIDPFPAEWCRLLVSAGLITPGRIDNRSVADLRADDLAGHTQGHLFAGICGWPLALNLAGWPEAEQVWSGSCPCQPISGVGQRRGHADERHLWPEFFRLIAECRPPIVFGEQVTGKAGREWLSAVRADFEDVGYAVGAADLCATVFGSNQERRRLFFFAHALSATAARRHPIVLRNGRDAKVASDRRHADWRESCEAGVLDDAISPGLAKALTRGFGNAIDPEVGAEFIIAAVASINASVG